MIQKYLFSDLKKLIAVAAIFGLAVLGGCSAHAGADFGGSPDYVVVGD